MFAFELSVWIIRNYLYHSLNWRYVVAVTFVLLICNTFLFFIQEFLFLIRFFFKNGQLTTFFLHLNKLPFYWIQFFIDLLYVFQINIHSLHLCLIFLHNVNKHLQFFITYLYFFLQLVYIFDLSFYLLHLFGLTCL